MGWNTPEPRLDPARLLLDLDSSGSLMDSCWTSPGLLRGPLLDCYWVLVGLLPDRPLLGLLLDYHWAAASVESLSKLHLGEKTQRRRPRPPAAPCRAASKRLLNAAGCIKRLFRDYYLALRPLLLRSRSMPFTYAPKHKQQGSALAATIIHGNALDPR